MIPSDTSFFVHDGFPVTAAEPWFKVKVQLIQRYLRSFVTQCAEKSDEIIVVDLFAGSGLYSFGYQKELFAGSCLASLQADLPISKWIFCERDPESAKALKIRVNKYFKGKNVLIFEDALEKLPEKLQYYVPQSKRGYRVSVFCIVDPFGIDIPFSMLDTLQGMGFSFVVPFTFSLNDRHNYRFYLNEHREKLKKYLGGYKDIEKLEDVKSNLEFYKRTVRMIRNNMLVLGLNSSLAVQRLDSGLMELPIYYVGIFSKLYPARVIQREVEETVHNQFTLFDAV
ncbi:MAG TPA: three-Cys-motif partner protein TcmP [Cyclobacteriaceae bacterium]|nr:three-Cys-motif partner protein TcmP [Cyclobacteriaceae bacterium]HRJ82766.1 three-Cys-motif partner protein TcmP [Cyclobacteriaceae bacterium]